MLYILCLDPKPIIPLEIILRGKKDFYVLLRQLPWVNYRNFYRSDTRSPFVPVPERAASVLLVLRSANPRYILLSVAGTDKTGQ